MQTRNVLLSASLAAFLLAYGNPVLAAVVTGGGLTLITTASGPGSDIDPTIDLTGAAPLVPYTASGTDIGAPFDLSNLNDGDLGPSDGTYAIPAGNAGSFELDFGGPATFKRIAVYMGYGNRDDGSYTIRDAASTVVGTFSISGTGGAAHFGVDLFLASFASPVTTSKLTIEYAITDLTPSFREIQIVVPEPSTMILSVLGMIGLVFFGRRRR